MKVLQIFCSLFSGLLLVGLLNDASAQKTDTYNLDQTYAISENGTIELESDDAGLVEVTGSDREDVRLIVTYRLEVQGFTIGKKDQFAMEVTERNGNLFIREKPRERGFNLNVGAVNKKYSITILAPQNTHLNLQGDDDTYEISDMNGNIQIESDDSDISVRDCTGEDFRFDFDDGELIMNDGHGTLAINYDDGEVDIRNGEFNNIDIETDDGDTDISTILDDNGSYSFQSDDGDIDLTVLGGGGEFRIEHDDVRISADSEFQQMERNENFTRYRLDGGSAKVNIDTDDGDIRLFIQ